ncbi:cobalamin biosynthesis protein [Parvularcula bermudensis HTCC2503]|uniref:Cobaltochelatase subunit CobT n=1 Tax=Parvularcula bermudensis (strain ATCC BAA-594 / HTCC2503 / KCTC 12087) TaxID=314260 RepID=E0THA7_PARBH|nr:cobaltochelatase subunit CobT [Parvularcula bermudensis]ADM10197.1 cobalamin biosynthesis protein [Parvularcula bermudensis HTCC2503]
MASSPSPAEQLKQLLAQTTKALAAEPDVTVKFVGDKPQVAGTDVRLPLPPRRMDEAQLAVARGHADEAALRLAHHDPALHARLAPQNADGAAAHTALETVRVEALGATALDGVGDNLHASLSQRLEDRGYRRMEDRQDIPLSDILGLMARERITGRPTPDAARALVDQWRREIEERAGDSLERLADRTLFRDQTAFSEAVHSLLRDLDIGDPTTDHEDSEDDETEGDDDEQPKDTETGGEDDADTEGEDGEDESQEDSAKEPAMPEFGEARDGEAEVETQPLDWEPTDDDADAQANAEMQRRNEPLADSNASYGIYTKDFDEVVHPLDLVDAAELARLRQTLDGQLESLHQLVARLANRLHRQLLAQQNRDWRFDLDEGILDASRLSRVVIDPTQPLSFKQEQDQAFRDTAVTLLIDNSGSMRGRPIMVAALCGDILARTLERCGVKVEILGFTTRAWKGGQSREKWVAEDRPKNPGRLNDLRHIIYKPASVPWRRAKDNLALMLKEGLLKENIDGEALQWAHDRLIQRPEARRILMVISDGAPVDDTTSSVNGGGYLERHLRETIAFIENASPIQLIAIGIGHDVTRFYDRALTIQDVDQLGGAMTEQLADLFADQSDGRRRPRRRSR